MYWNHIMTESEIYTYEYFLQEDICRLCWNKNANTKIFDENEVSAENSLLQIIKECLDINMYCSKHNKVCESCCGELRRFYSFKIFCQNSDKNLKNIIKKGMNGIGNKVIDIEIVKDEITDDTYERLDDVLDEPVDFEEPKSKKTLIKRNSITRHKYLHKVSPTYCNICCLELETKDGLLTHNSDYHGIENGGTSFKCFGCEKRFKTRKLRMSHESNFCRGLKNGYKCNICNRYLPKRCTYECHMRDHRHNKVPVVSDYLFKCKKCGKTFKSMELLRNHKLEHLGQDKKTFICDTCGRVFTRQDYLFKHKLIHTGVKRHECPHCDFKATQRSSLTVHIRKHTGERPFSCDICSLRCTSSSNLKAHRRRHLGVKKFECTICFKKYGYKTSLEEHMSSAHVRSEVHTCEHCGVTYTRLRGLKRHLAAKHGKQSKKNGEQNVIIQVTEDLGNNIHVEYEMKDGDNVLLLKHQDGDVYMV